MCYPPVQGRLFTRYSPVRHYLSLLSTEVSIPLIPFDLHGLGTPPAFVLSQDQTLNKSLKKSFDFLFLLVSVLRLSFAFLFVRIISLCYAVFKVRFAAPFCGQPLYSTTTIFPLSRSFFCGQRCVCRLRVAFYCPASVGLYRIPNTSFYVNIFFSLFDFFLQISKDFPEKIGLI